MERYPCLYTMKQQKKGGGEVNERREKAWLSWQNPWANRRVRDLTYWVSLGQRKGHFFLETGEQWSGPDENKQGKLRQFPLRSWHSLWSVGSSVTYWKWGGDDGMGRFRRIIEWHWGAETKNWLWHRYACLGDCFPCIDAQQEYFLLQ